MSGLKAETNAPAITMDGCQALANAIVAQAAKDYRAAIRQRLTAVPGKSPPCRSSDWQRDWRMSGARRP